MSYVFFLGGRDLEMLTILELLMKSGAEYHSKSLDWGAKASMYAQEVFDAWKLGITPVLVELEIDIELPNSSIVIDHHNERSGEEASILQVIRLLGLTPTRDHTLVAANDSGYIPAMLREGASEDEVADIRKRDRRAQGVTEAMELQAVNAILLAKRRNGVVIVTLPHSKFSPVSDRLFNSWPDSKENLLVVCRDDESFVVYYFGRGDICQALKETFSGFGGGKGFGDPLGNGFSGCRTLDPDAIENVIEFVIGRQ